MITKSGRGIRTRVITIPAVLGPRLVINFAVVVRVLGRLEKILH
jgi:hypothetical protein